MSGLAEIQQAAGVGELFDTLLVFENYPVDRDGLAAAGGSGLRARPGRGPRRDALSAGADRAAGRDAAAAARLPARPVRRGDASRRIGRAAASGCWRPRLRTPARPLGSLPILEAAERATILRGWNDTARSRSPPRDPAGAVCRAGGAHAGCGRGGVRGPHAELRRARRPRQPAGASSAEPGRRPRDAWSGLCVERSPEMVVGLLGMLKAGGAYLPLDPDYPARAAGLHAGGRRLPRCW